MIKNRQDLKEYNTADKSRYGKRCGSILGWLYGDEGHVVLKYLEKYRKLEYYTNKKKKLWDYLPYAYIFLSFRRMRIRTGVFLNINSVGKGLYIPHISGGIYVNCEKMGDYCIVSSGCVIGSKRLNDGSVGRPTIGNNVEICVGAKVIGKVTIGDNVIIAPNSVVISDVPENAIVSGVPANIIKIKDS